MSINKRSPILTMSKGKKFNVKSLKISEQLNHPFLVAFEFQILYNTLFLFLKKNFSSNYLENF